MKKKYITPKIETTMCLLEDFIAATGGSGTGQTQDGKGTDITTDENAENAKSKWHTTWDTWED